MLLSLIVFVALSLWPVCIGAALRGDPAWRGWAAYSIASGVLVLVFFVATDLVASLVPNGPAGLVQRLSIITGWAGSPCLPCGCCAETRPPTADRASNGTQRGQDRHVVSNQEYSMSLIETKNVTKIYGSGETALRAVDRINLTVKRASLSPSWDPAAVGNRPCCTCWAAGPASEGQVLIDGQELSRWMTTTWPKCAAAGLGLSSSSLT